MLDCVNEELQCAVAVDGLAEVPLTDQEKILSKIIGFFRDFKSETENKQIELQSPFPDSQVLAISIESYFKRFNFYQNQ
jgi:hypothetical protein